MSWKLQNNPFTKKDLLKYSKYLINSKKLTQGEMVKYFEKQFSSWNKSKYSIYVNSGSSANLITVFAAKEYFGWKDGDEIIVPSLTWPTTVTPVLQAGLKPKFIDCNLEDLSIGYNNLKKVLSKKTKAIFIAHILGYPANIKKIKKIIGNKKIIILEDCCESIGAKINNKKIGNFGLAGTFSFYWGHHMTTIEGGMITTNSRKFYELCMLKRSHGFARDLDKKKLNLVSRKYKDIDKNFLFLTDGFNVRSTNFNAFIGNHQLKKLNKYINIRNNNFKIFLTVIKKFKKIIFSVGKLNTIKNLSSYAFPIIFYEKKNLDKFKKLCKKNNIEFRPIISGNLLCQPFLKNKYSGSFPNSNLIHNFGIYLGNNQFINNKNFLKLEKLLLKFKI